MLVKGVVFRLESDLPCEARFLLEDFRLAVNNAIRVNLLQTAVLKGMAGGLRFNPGAYQHDVMMALYDPVKGARSEPNGTSGICEMT